MSVELPLTKTIAPTSELHNQYSPEAVRARDRISSIDILRGAALLGILVLNIDSFGTSEMMHDIPLGSPIDNFSGSLVRVTMSLLIVKWMFFEAKMRGLFSMLFGAGVILITRRAEQRGAGEKVADIYMRRNLILTLFGFLHSTFIWMGDILFNYGFVALLFLYPCRKLKAKTLIWMGSLISLFIATPGLLLLFNIIGDIQLHHQVASIHAIQHAGEPFTEADKTILNKWRAVVDAHASTPEKIRAAVAKGKEPYWAGVYDRLSTSFQSIFVKIHIDALGDHLSAMLIGMGLMKLGFFSLELPSMVYMWTALIGFGISLPVYALGIAKAHASGFFFFDTELWMFVPYYLTRDAGMVAISAVLLLIIRLGWFRSLQKRLAAVGRTALSNYLATSLICQIIFLWDPWPLYGKLAYYQLMGVVFAVWGFNLSVSPLWLRFFAFGPVEWLWRSLTYGKLQSMRISAETTSSTHAMEIA